MSTLLEHVIKTYKNQNEKVEKKGDEYYVTWGDMGSVTDGPMSQEKLFERFYKDVAKYGWTIE